jgi:hypothetical protein
MSAKKMLSLDIEELKKAIVKIVPIIADKAQEIVSLIDSVPEQYEGIPVCSKIRKDYYKLSLAVRYEKLLKPAYETYELIYELIMERMSKGKENAPSDLIEDNSKDDTAPNYDIFGV